MKSVAKAEAAEGACEVSMTSWVGQDKWATGSREGGEGRGGDGRRDGRAGEQQG